MQQRGLHWTQTTAVSNWNAAGVSADLLGHAMPSAEACDEFVHAIPFLPCQITSVG